jgi:hypothetical protein
MNPIVTIRGMSMNSTAWRATHRKQSSEFNEFLYGGFEKEEFIIWMQHQNNSLFNDNQKELILLTGKVPIFLSIFARLYKNDISWESLVKDVLNDSVVTNLRGYIGNFYKDFHAADVWTVYTHLVSPIPSYPNYDSIIDHRFFYKDEENMFTSTGEIASRLLFHIWKEKVADDQILRQWPDLLNNALNPSVRGFLVEEVIKAVVLKDGVGKYRKTDSCSIGRVTFESGKEKISINFCLPRIAQNSWFLLDPEIFNYGGVDMILITDKSIVGINVTISSTHTPMRPFFDVWRPIAAENNMTIEGLFVAPDGFTHNEDDVIILYLRNVYNELWKVLYPHHPIIQDHSCVCATDCSSNRCGCKKAGKQCSTSCKCENSKCKNG